mgnify:CR=1 FL=1
MIEKLIMCNINDISIKTTIAQRLREHDPLLVVDDDPNGKYIFSTQDYTNLFFSKNTMFLIVSDMRAKKSGSQCTMKFPPFGFPYIHVILMMENTSGFSRDLHTIQIQYIENVSLMDLNELHERMNLLYCLNCDVYTDTHLAAYWNNYDEYIRSLCGQLLLLKNKNGDHGMHVLHLLFKLIEQQKM